MAVWSEIPASVTPPAVIVPLGNARYAPAVVPIDDPPPARQEDPAKPKRAYTRRRKDTHDG